MNGRPRYATLARSAIFVVILPVIGPWQAPLAQGNARPPRGVALQSVVAGMSRSAGVQVLADSTVAREMVPPPAKVATVENLEQEVQALSTALPRGATWVKLYLPAANIAMNADAVTQFAVAQARLFGRRIGGASTGGTVEIMGQALPADRAHDVIAALNLKLVYLITNPNAPATASNGTLQQFANMDSNGRMQMMQQMQQQMVQQAAEFKGMIEQMTPAERDQFEQMMSSNGLRIKIRTDAGPGP